MAWFLQSGSEGFSVTKFAMEPPCRDLTPPVEYFQENDCLELYGRLWWSAVDIDNRFWPRRARMITDRKALPHKLGFCSFWGISESFRECVEHVEPGIHEFREVEILKKDGSKFGERYYALNVRNRVKNAVNWHNTTAPFEDICGRRLLRSPQTLMNHQTVFLNKESIEGFHLCIIDDNYPGTCMTVSDHLYKLLDRRKLLRGIDAIFATEI